MNSSKRTPKEAFLLRRAFRKKIDENDGICPRCCKRVEKLADRSIMYHCDERCRPFATEKTTD